MDILSASLCSLLEEKKKTEKVGPIDNSPFID